MHIFIIFNFWLVHNMKDTLIVASAHSGAEAISFIKMWAVFPVSVLFIMVYTWLSNRVSQRALFSGIVWSFVIFYGIFALYLHPHQDALQMAPERIAALQVAHPHLKWFFPMVGYWTYTLFYVFSELWATIVLTLLFWQFANQITAVDEAKRFYMMFSTFSALGMVAAGITTKSLNQHFETWDHVLNGTILMILFNCVVILMLYRWMCRHVVRPDQEYHTVTEEKEEGLPEGGSQEIKLSLWESLKYVMRSDYLIYIAIIFVAYNISINLIEVTWKSQLKIVYATKQAYNSFMGDFNIWLAGSMFITGLIGVNVVRKFSWYSSAMTTPLVILITGSLFFFLALFGEQCFAMVGVGICAPLVACWVGLVQNLSARCCKFSFFNTTREMAYMPLDAELKTKGKAAVDVLSTSFGKMGCATIQQTLLILIPFSTHLTIAPYIAVILLVIIAAWIWGVKKLNVRFLALIDPRRRSRPSS